MAEKTVAQVAASKANKEYKTEFREAMTRLYKSPSSMIGLSIFVILVVLSIVAPLLSPYGYAEMNIGNRFQLPSAAHWFGTDDLGRDVFTRIMYGGRFSLSIAFISSIVGLVFGIVIGAISGYYGGVIDNAIMRFLDIFQSIPGILMTICISAVLGAGFDKTIMALAITQIPEYARTLRAQVLSVRQLDYVEAAGAIGCGTTRQIVRYVVPNSFSPLLVQWTMKVAMTVLTTASLSFIGLGIQPPTPEWGAMLTAAKGWISSYPYLLVSPGVFIALTVLGLNLFGDGLRDALDPKLKD